VNLPSAIAVFLHPGSGWIWAVAGAGAGVCLFFRGFRVLQRKRLILNTPTSKIRSASMGLVEISGLAVGQKTLSAPITGVPCYYYRTVAWQPKQSGKNEEWVIVAEETLHVPFYLDDNTGRVLIDPQGAEMDIHRDFHEEFGNSLFSSRIETPANVSIFLSRHGVSGERKTKIDEYCIKPKNALFVLGTLAENTPDSSPGSGDSETSCTLKLELPGAFNQMISPVPASRHNGTEEVIRISAGATPVNSTEMTAQGKIAAALLKAGITSPAAWAAAGIDNLAGSSTSVDTATRTLAEFDAPAPAVLRKGSHDPSFFISWRSQKEVVNSLGWKSTAMIWGGPALTLACLYFLVTYLNWF
jgi:E3 ubiquitin ligase